MNGSLAGARDLAKAAAELAGRTRTEIALCPPFPLLAPVAAILSGTAAQLGAQDCHAQDKGAYTGDVAAPLLREIGCRYVILGHSERRAQHRESDPEVRAKVAAAWRAGLGAIICVGETESERELGRTRARLALQVQESLPDGANPANTVIAYEPVWAIGSGRTPRPEEVSELHAFLRAALVARIGPEADSVRILYGGSVKADNARALMGVPEVDGALVGGASLDAKAFSAIAEACRET